MRIPVGSPILSGLLAALLLAVPGLAVAACAPDLLTAGTYRFLHFDEDGVDAFSGRLTFFADGRLFADARYQGVPVAVFGTYQVDGNCTVGIVVRHGDRTAIATVGTLSFGGQIIHFVSPADPEGTLVGIAYREPMP